CENHKGHDNNGNDHCFYGRQCAIVSVGDSLDVDFADLLDHFALDRGTRTIMLYGQGSAQVPKPLASRAVALRHRVLALDIVPLETGFTPNNCTVPHAVFGWHA